MNGVDFSDMPIGLTNSPLQLLRTRSASDRFPAFSKAASSSQTYIDAQRQFIRSMSAQEAEGRKEKEMTRRPMITRPANDEDKENMFRAEAYPSDLPWIERGEQSWQKPNGLQQIHTEKSRPLHYARSMNHLSSKKEESKVQPKIAPPISPLRERRNKMPLTIKAPILPNFKRSRAKSSASFSSNIHSPPPCPPPTTPLPEIPLLSPSSVNSKRVSELYSTPLPLMFAPTYQAKSHSKGVHNSDTSISSPSTTSPASSKGEEGDFIFKRATQTERWPQTNQESRSNNQDYFFQRLTDQLNLHDPKSIETHPLMVQINEGTVDEENCIYGLAM